MYTLSGNVNDRCRDDTTSRHCGHTPATSNPSIPPISHAATSSKNRSRHGTGSPHTEHTGKCASPNTTHTVTPGTPDTTRSPARAATGSTSTTPNGRNTTRTGQNPEPRSSTNNRCSADHNSDTNGPTEISRHARKSNANHEPGSGIRVVADAPHGCHDGRPTLPSPLPSNMRMRSSFPPPPAPPSDQGVVSWCCCS